MKTSINLRKIKYLVFGMFFIAFLGFSQTQTFTSNGTFTVPAGVTSVTVEAWGGGGAGGGCTTLTRSTGGGGAGGSYTKTTLVAVTSGATISVTVGAGGIGVSGANGGIGGTSTFASTSPVSAIGGTGGNANGTLTPLNGLGANTTIGSTYNGGAGGVGDATSGTSGTSGGGGGGAGSTSSGSAPTTGINAGIGGTGGGGNGAIGTATSGNGIAAIALSGGGSGGRNNGTGSLRTGGNGYRGQVIITWIAPQEINIQGNGVTILSGDSSPAVIDYTNFGSVDVSSGAITKTFTVQNTGGASLTIGAISFSGTNASDFSITTPPSSTLGAGLSTSFIIAFDPSITGIKNAIISIVNNDGNENPYVFAIQGTGNQTYFDSDGDGVFDNIDIDDDNDGILDVTEETNCNLANGHKVNYKFLDENFGTGSRTTINTTYDATTTYCYADGLAGTNTAECPSLSDTSLNDGEYTVGSSAQIATWASQYWYTGGDHTSGDTNGRMAMFNASYTPGIFYTASITGALPNIPITYSFWVINLDRSDAPGISTRLRPNIKVEFRDINDNLLTSISTGQITPTSVSNASGDWYQFTANLNLNVNTFKVIFINNETGGAGNDLAIDDILISQTLGDRDGDGVADVFDLDSDNDGIPDIVEVGLGSISDGKGKISTAWIDANGNGLLDAAEVSAALPALDSDGDGIPNYIDLDSDNDSVFDVDEAGTGNSNAATGYNNGDGDINGDGVGDGLETESFRSKDTNGDGINEGFGDGILDIYDYGTGANQYGNLNQGSSSVNSNTAFLTDTDTDGIPDYLDTTSNGSSYDIANNKLIYDYKVLDANNDGILDGTTDIDKDGVLDSFDTNIAQFGSPRDLNTKLFLDFDGRNDYGQSTEILGGLASSSLMAWIDLNPNFTTEGVIMGQNKFQIRITSARELEVVLNNTTLKYATPLNYSQWYNVATTYDGSILKLFLNGDIVATHSASGGIASDTSLFTIGKDPSTNAKYFKGKIDEVRVFNMALPDSQLQRMIYQEIQNNASQIRGAIVPKNIATTPNSLPFANLLRYYRMDVYKDDVIDDLTTTATDLTGAKIYNNKNINIQQAPMPFITERTGDFAIAVNSPTNDIRGLDIMENWSIVRVKHDITETVNTIDIGMIVDPGKTITMNNDTKIQNDWYLKLDGKIDLVGKSQLLQTSESDLDATSAGYIERDQQGQSNLYNYNYWSSPTSPVNIIANNTNYTIGAMLKDGTTSTPQNINWVAGYNGAPTTPISIAKYWLFKFDNYANAYANWSQLTETSALRVGQGFTMKGSGAISGTQNLTFVGKPNNGLITTNTVAADQLLLTGNPYPSALDANAFITDNTNSIDGTLYFWEHYTSNNTHILREYQGGYAERNLTGGIPPISAGVEYISHLGTPSKGAPNQFIPVGQGFFVTGKSGAGGTIIFNNGQRGFHKEDEAGISNVMYKITANAKKPKSSSVASNNNNDPIKVDNFMKIRLGYNSNANYHRQSLLGFMNENASKDFDYGYDGLNIDDFANDMYFLCGKTPLAIQGVGYFKKEDVFPIGVKTNVAGKVIFSIDELENFDKNQKVYIYDKETKIYHNIKDQTFEIVLPIGQFDNRFLLCFKERNHPEDNAKNQDDSNAKIQARYSHVSSALKITNTSTESTVYNVSLFNILGQFISKWEITNLGQNNIEIPILNISAGIYITKINTSNGVFSRKIMIP